MKTYRMRRLSLLLSLIMPLTSQAHDSLEAMRQGGSLMKLTAALLHPVLETQFWSFLLLGLLVSLTLYGAGKSCRQFLVHIVHGRRFKPVRAEHRRNVR